MRRNRGRFRGHHAHRRDTASNGDNRVCGADNLLFRAGTAAAVVAAAAAAGGRGGGAAAAAAAVAAVAAAAATAQQPERHRSQRHTVEGHGQGPLAQPKVPTALRTASAGVCDPNIDCAVTSSAATSGMPCGMLLEFANGGV